MVGILDGAAKQVITELEVATYPLRIYENTIGPGVFGICKWKLALLRPAAKLIRHDAVCTPCTNNPIQSPIIDFEGAVQVTDMDMIEKAYAELGKFENDAVNKIKCI